jgi:hypothetical protein
MSADTCWLCLHCDLNEVCEMMQFVEEKSPVMHIDAISNQVSAALRDTYPDEEDINETTVKNHICRHVVTPVASVTRITRDLLDMCETLRPRRDASGARGTKRNADRMTDAEREPPCTGEALETTSNDDASDNQGGGGDNTTLYLRTVAQVMGIYRMHHRLLGVSSMVSSKV